MVATIGLRSKAGEFDRCVGVRRLSRRVDLDPFENGQRRVHEWIETGAERLQEENGQFDVVKAQAGISPMARVGRVKD